MYMYLSIASVISVIKQGVHWNTAKRERKRERDREMRGERARGTKGEKENVREIESEREREGDGEGEGERVTTTYPYMQGENAHLLGKLQSFSTLCLTPDVQTWEENTKHKLDQKTWGKKEAGHTSSSNTLPISSALELSLEIPKSFSMFSSAP